MFPLTLKLILTTRSHLYTITCNTLNNGHRIRFRFQQIYTNQQCSSPDALLLLYYSPMSKQTYTVCFCFRRRFRLTAAEAPPDVKSIFLRYSENGVMNAECLRRFMLEVQGEAGVTLEEAQGVIDGIHEIKHLHLFHRKGLTLDAFFKYLLADFNSPLDQKRKIHHDMTAPLSHYFIYTSHNTYLTGNQLSSDSSDIPIIHALQAGVRGIELDMWPNAAKDNVDIKHGRTLTTPVELIKCLRSIKEHAFTASEYPLIITLEDHLTPDLQALAAEMITQTFGDMLFFPGPELMTEFPSPETLKRRIIISTKPPKAYLDGKKLEGKDSNSDKDDNTDGEGIDTNVENTNLQQQLVAEYMNLIGIPAMKGKEKLQHLLMNNLDDVKRLSLSEQVFKKAIADKGKQIISFTQKNVLRVYPKAIRVDSSNFNPYSAWMHGAQMVALNMQGYGKSLWLMQGMFRANGGCGYIKKPDFLLQSDTKYEFFNPAAVLRIKTTLKVTVYMGEGWYYDFPHTHFDYYSPPDLYVKIGIGGVPGDKTKKKTKRIEDSWIPTWDEVFEFGLTAPELAVLRIEVCEYDAKGKGRHAGQTCLPVPELRQGIRSVPLHNRKGVKYKSVKLLVKFEFV